MAEQLLAVPKNYFPYSWEEMELFAGHPFEVTDRSKACSAERCCRKARQPLGDPVVWPRRELVPEEPLTFPELGMAKTAKGENLLFAAFPKIGER